MSNVRDQSEDDGGRMTLRRFLEGLRTDQHGDVEEDGKDGDAWDEGKHYGNGSKPAEEDDHDARGGGVANAPAHGLPARVTNVHGIDEWIAHEAADQTDHAIGGKDARGWEIITCHCCALHVVDCFHQVIDSEWNGGDEEDSEELETGEDMTEDRQRNMKPEVRHGIGKAFHTHSPIIETKGGRAPGNHSAHGNGQQAGGNSAVTHAA